MRRRRAIGGVAGILALAGVALWWSRGREASSPRERVVVARPDGEVAPGGSRIDVATVARAAIEGTVRDPTGAAIAGAQVCGTASSRDLAPEDRRSPMCAATGGDGRYRLSGLLPARYTVGASAPEFVPGLHRDRDRRTRFRLAAGEERRGIDIVLYRGGVELTGTVKDIGGGPIEGAWMSATGTTMDGAFSQTLSRADGTFKLWVAPGDVTVSTTADGYASATTRTSAPADGLVVLLTPESSLSGRVVEAGSGAAVPGARVIVGLGGDEAEGPSMNLSTVTDEQGRFRFDHLRPGRYKPFATAPRGYGQARESVLLGVGQTVDAVVIELHPAQTVRGRVLASGDGAPCRGGTVTLIDTGRDRHRTRGIDEDGRVEIEGLLPGRYGVWIWCDEYLPEESYPDLVVAAAPPPEQVWKVRAAGRIRGKVTAGGVPVAGAGIMAVQHSAGGTMYTSGGAASTGADGTFVTGPLTSATYEVAVRASDHPPPSEPVEVAVVEGREATVEIRLGEGGGVAGEVVDERGQPVAGASVRAYPTTVASMAMGNDPTVTTGRDGTFAVRGLGAGPHQVLVTQSMHGPVMRRPGERPGDSMGEKVEVMAGKTARVRLVVERQDGVIRGRVADARGQPITDAFVDAELEPDSPSGSDGPQRAIRSIWGRNPVMTDTGGEFAIEKLAAGTYTLRAYRRGGGEALAEKVAIGARVTLTIRPTGSITGSVEGSAPEEFTVTVADEKTGFSRRESFFRTGGSFTMRALPAGSFAVLVGAAQGTGRGSVQLAEGQDVTGLVIRLVARASVTGRIVSIDEGGPLAGVMMSARSADEQSLGISTDGMRSASARSDAAGRFTLEDMPAGQVEILALPFGGAGHSFVRRVVKVEAGRSTDIGDLFMARQRVKPGEPVGDLGFETDRTRGDASPSAPIVVSAIRSDGPAVGSGLQVGDTIVSVDGHDVRVSVDLYWTLVAVPPGRTVLLGLARGASARITAAGRP